MTDEERAREILGPAKLLVRRDGYYWTPETVNRVAAALAEVRREERERCARIISQHLAPAGENASSLDDDWNAAMHEIADAIRKGEA